MDKIKNIASFPADLHEKTQEAVKDVPDIENMSPDQIRDLIHNLLEERAQMNIRTEILRKSYEERTEQLEEEIIERKQIEENLSQSEERFRTLVTASSEVLYQMSPDWSEMSQLYSRGFLVNTERPDRNWLQEYIPPSDQPRVIAAIDKAIRNKSVFELEHRVRRADGTLGWTFSHAVPIIDANGEIIEWFGIASDITERKHSEEALRESEERIRLATNVPYIILAESDEELRYTWIQNPHKDFNPSSVIGKRDDELDSSNEIEHLVKLKNQVFESGQSQRVEWSVKRSDGRHFYDFCIQPRYDENKKIVGVRTAVLDITEWRRAEESLRESKTLLETVVENTDTLLAYIDINYNFIWVNRAYADAAAQDVSFFPGKNHFELYPNEDNERLFRQVIETGEPIFITDKPFEYPDQPERGTTWWNWSLFPVKYETGQTLGLVFSLLETTRFHMIQQEMEKLRAERESFLRHEVKNLLTPLMIYLGSLGMDPQISEKHRKILKNLEKSLNRANSFITQLKKITDLELGDYTLEKIPYSLVTVIFQTIEELLPLAEQNGVIIIFENHAGDIIMPLDKNFLPGVFNNLIRNAVEHVAHSEDPLDKIVRVQLNLENDSYMIRINNRGDPIPPERISSFFEKFNVGPEKTGGTGLGTSYARLITEAHGGIINVTSNENEGTTVTIIFPMT